MIIRPETTSYRIKRGTSFADIPTNPPPALAELDSPFQYAEYLSLKVRHDPHDIEGLVKVPVSENEDGSPNASGSSGPRKGNEKDLWIYEHLRRLPIDLTALVTSLLGTCTAETCPTMKADQWQYLCVAHGSEGAEECSAIDYILHTLDSTTSLLNSSETFPSRIQIPSASLAHFPSLFRRLSRIFSHAYYHHRELFSLAEAETSLYARFWALCERYDLVNTKLLIIPREVVAESIDGKAPSGEEDEEEDNGDDDDEEEEDEEDDDGEDDGRNSRTREKGENGPRPHSLDRHARPHKLDDLRQKGEGTVKGWAAGTGDSSKSTSLNTWSRISESASSSTPKAEPAEEDQDPLASSEATAPSLVSPAGPSSGMTASNAKTLGRSGGARKGRGTMLWTSDSATTSDPVPAPPPTAVTEDIEGAPLERTESIETAILVDEIADIPEPTTLSTEEGEPDVPEPAVPKDEIELLEGEGKIPTEGAVSPLPPPASSDTPSETLDMKDPEADPGSDEMQEIALDEGSGRDEGGAEAENEPTSTEDESISTEPSDGKESK